MGIQAHVRQRDFKQHGGVVELNWESRWHQDDDREWEERVPYNLFLFPSGLRATSYHPIDLVFDCRRANQEFVAELVAMGCPFIKS